jgi:hypothetical protein
VPSLLAFWPVAAVGAVVAVLAGIGVIPRWPGAFHLVAVPPLDLWADLRILVSEAPSYPAFVAGAAASVAGRTLALGAVLAAFGAGGWRRALRLYLGAWVPMAVAAGLEFAGYAALYHWYFWAGLVLGVGTAVLVLPRIFVVPGPAEHEAPWLAVALAYLLVLGALGAWADALGPWGGPILLPVSALLTMVALRTLAGPRGRLPRVPRPARVAAGVLLVAAAVVPPAGTAGTPAEPGAVLLMVPGVDTASGEGILYRFDPRTIGFSCDRVYYYSYLGPGDGAEIGQAPCQIRVHEPYRRSDTQAPLAQLAAAFEEQVTAIEGESGGAPVVVLTHSQGSVIAWRAIASGRAEGVSHLVMLGGLTRSAASYPPFGRNGPGRVGGDVLRILSAAFRGLGSSTFDPDAPLAREVLARPRGLEEVFSDPLPDGVSAAGVAASLDASVAPSGWDLRGAPWATVDTTHTRLVFSDRSAELIRRALAGRPGSGPTTLARVLGGVLPAFGPPAP